VQREKKVKKRWLKGFLKEVLLRTSCGSKQCFVAIARARTSVNMLPNINAVNQVERNALNNETIFAKQTYGCFLGIPQTATLKEL